MSSNEIKPYFKVSITTDGNGFHTSPTHHLIEYINRHEYLAQAMYKANLFASWDWTENVWINEYNSEGDEVGMYVVKREKIIL